MRRSGINNPTDCRICRLSQINTCSSSHASRSSQFVSGLLLAGPCAESDVVLELKETRSGNRRQLRFVAPMAGETSTEPREGTGLRYVRARLEEAYGAAWSLTSGAGPAGWTTEIEVPA